MNMRFFNFKLAVILAAAILIPACGGGGGGGSFSPPQTNEVIIGDGGNRGGEGDGQNQMVAVAAEVRGDYPLVPVTGEIALMENEGVVIRISADAAAPTDGGMVLLGVAIDGDSGNWESVSQFSIFGADCEGLFCAIRIPQGVSSVEVTLTPVGDGINEFPASWQIFLAGDDYFSADNSNSIRIQVTDATDAPADDNSPPPAPQVVQEIMPMQGANLPAQNAVLALARNFQYASLGAWFNGDLANIDENSIPLGFETGMDNIVAPPSGPNSGKAEYQMIGDGVYKGVPFFPNGRFEANFADGTAQGIISAHKVQMQGISPSASTNFNHRLRIRFDSVRITPNGFEGGRAINENSESARAYWRAGIFADIPGELPNFSLTGKFHDASDDYNIDTDIPRELSGVMNGIVNSIGDDQVELGFIGEFYPRKKAIGYNQGTDGEDPLLPYQPRQLRHITEFPAKQPHALQPGILIDPSLQDLIDLHGPPTSLSSED